MPQTFNVIRCFSCSTFQVDQVKKSKKWACKVCGEKQSLIKVYGQGTGAECRQHVQKLNLLRQDMDEKEYQMDADPESLDDPEETEEFEGHSFTTGSDGSMNLPSSSPSSSSISSKWSQFLPVESDPETTQSQMEESDYVEDSKIEEKSPSSQNIFKIPNQVKRKNPFFEVSSSSSSSRAPLPGPNPLMKKLRTAITSNFQLSSVNCDQSNNWSHSVSNESRHPGTNLVTCQRPVRFEHSSPNSDTLTSNKSWKTFQSDTGSSHTRKDFSRSYTKETNVDNLNDAQCDKDFSLWMATPQCRLSSNFGEGNDFPQNDFSAVPRNVERGLSKRENDFLRNESATSPHNVQSGLFKMGYEFPQKDLTVSPRNVKSRYFETQNDFPRKDLSVSPHDVKSGHFETGIDLPQKGFAVTSSNIERGLSKSLSCENGLKNRYNGSTRTNQTLPIENLLQKDNCDDISLSSNVDKHVDKQKTDVVGQISTLSSISCSKRQNDISYPNLDFSNNLDKEKLALKSTESNSLKNIFQIDESEVDLDF